MLVFLSYSRRDAAFVGRLADDLAARDIDSWLDTDDLPIDDEDRWRRSIVQGIRESAAIVLVLSPDSVRSEAVERELTIAAEMSRRIIPIVHRTCELSDGLVFELAGLQRTDFVEQAYPVALDELVQRINAGRPARPEPPQTPSAVIAPVLERSADGAARTGGDVRTRGWKRRVVGTVAVVVTVAALIGFGLLPDRDGAGDASPISTGTAAAGFEPSGATVIDEGSEDTSDESAEPSTRVPWEAATATIRRRDGTTAIVQADDVAIGCGVGSIEFMNGQTISLELVDRIRFDTNDTDSGSIDAVVTLLDGRHLPDPIRTRNCPISGTTDLGPLTIPPDDIEHIAFHR